MFREGDNPGQPKKESNLEYYRLREKNKPRYSRKKSNPVEYYRREKNRPRYSRKKRNPGFSNKESNPGYSRSKNILTLKLLNFRNFKKHTNLDTLLIPTLYFTIVSVSLILEQ